MHGFLHNFSLCVIMKIYFNFLKNASRSISFFFLLRYNISVFIKEGPLMELLQSTLDRVIQRNPDDKEFIQAVTEETPGIH